MVPGLIMLFIFLITPYSIGTELKFNRARDWMRMANNNPYLAIAGKMLPQTLIFLSIFLLFEFYIYYVLGFPHPGGAAPIILLGILSVLSCQCFGIFAFGLMPSLGCGEFLHLRSHLSTLLHGFANPGHRTALPYAPLLYDLPDEHLQWFPDERCCAPLGRDGPLLCPANAHRLEYQEGNVSI